MPRKRSSRSSRNRRVSLAKRRVTEGSKLNLDPTPAANLSRNAVWNPPAQANSFKGNIPLGVMSDTDSVTISITGATILATTASGGVSTLILINPTGQSDFSSFAGLYAEYRVLGMRLSYVPYSLNWSSTVSSTGLPLVVYVSRDSGLSVASSLAAAFNYGDKIITSSQEQWEKMWRMSGPLEAQWLNTRSPSAVGAFGIVGAPIATASVNLGNIFFSFLIQFRNRY